MNFSLVVASKLDIDDNKNHNSYANMLFLAKHFIEYLFNFCGIDLSSVSYHIRYNPALTQQLQLGHIK